MKIGISISDSLFRRADKNVMKFKISRNRFFQRAIMQDLKDRKRSLIIEKLNEVYSMESSGINLGVKAMQYSILREVDW
jgi:hypothetical protein